MDGIFRTESADAGAVGMASGGMPLLEGIETALALGAAITFSGSSDGGANGISVLFGGSRVGRMWVRSSQDLSDAVDVLTHLTVDDLIRAQAALEESGRPKTTGGLARGQAARSRGSGGS